LGIVERFEGEFFRLCKQRAPHALLTFTEAGLALGATILARLRRSAAGVETLDLSDEDRIVAALTATFLAPVDVALLGKLRRACDLWARGDKRPGADLSGRPAPPADRRGAGIAAPSRRPADGVGLFAARTLQAVGLRASGGA